MAEDMTDRLELPLLFAGQALKEMFHNQALQKLDVLVQPVVQSADLSVPPPSPTAGAAWIVAAAPSGAWASHAGEMACWSDGWQFVMPRIGWRFHVVDRGHAMAFDGTAWADEPVRGDGVYLAGNRVLAYRQGAISAPSGGSVVDAQARSAIVNILAAMRTHGLIG